MAAPPAGVAGAPPPPEAAGFAADDDAPPGTGGAGGAAGLGNARGKAEGAGTLTHLENGRETVIERGQYHNDHFVQGRIEFLRNGLTYEGGWSISGPQGHGRLDNGSQAFEGNWEGGCLKTKEGWISFTRPAEECDPRHDRTRAFIRQVERH